MRILVSGGSGRIGTLLVAALVANGHQVINIDIAIHGALDFSKLTATDYLGFDCVVHLAANTSVQVCQKNPSEAVRNNIETTHKAIEIAELNGCPILFLSTAAVYGEDHSAPIYQTKSVYGTTKMLSEMLINNASVPYCIMRLFNVIMFDMVGLALIPTVQKALLQSRSIRVSGNGSSTRDFISVDSVVALMIDVIEKKKFYREVYDVGSGRETSIIEVVSQLMTSFKTKVCMIRQPRPSHDIHRSVADTRAIRLLCPDVEILGFYDALPRLTMIQ